MAEAAHPVYAVADCARAPFLYPLIQQIHPMEAYCLLGAKTPEPLREVGAFLFPAARSAPIMARWKQEGLGRSWGIFLTSPLGFDEVRRHLKRFLQVKLPDGTGPVLFRLWDPRVLHPFLHATEAGQLAQLFARVSSYVVETPAGLERLTFDGQALRAMPARWEEIAA